MYTVELKVDAVTGGLNRAATALDDKTPLMDDIGEIQAASPKARFPLDEAPYGSKWVAKPAATLAWKTGTRPLFGATVPLSSLIFHEVGPDLVAVVSNLVRPRRYGSTVQRHRSRTCWATFWRGCFWASRPRTK